MTDAAQLNEALSANYLLVDLEIRSWSAKRTDKDATNEVINSHQAAGNAGKFIKYLFAGADAELTAVNKLAQAIREFVYSNTLPWSGNVEGVKRGPRLLPATRSIEFLRELNQIKQEYDNAVAALAAVWDARKQQALSSLGTLAKTDDYPDAAAVVGLFGVTVGLLPVPSQTDFTRVNVPAALAEALGQRHAQAAQVHVEVAMGELKERLLTCINRMATQLGKAGAGEKTRLYDSLVTNLQALVGLTRTMNVAGKPEISELADRIEKELLHQPVEVYRNDNKKAAEIASRANEIAVAAAVEDIWKVL
ncbi:MAG TPA: hypothetical protein VN734_17305 [Acidobacteriaceae bacterium]|nr:hypothetical protein [Acidobacteriaceae bacterium]